MNEINIDRLVEQGVVKSNPLREKMVFGKAEKVYWQDKPDSFDGKTLVKEKSNNGKFDFSEALKNFGKGIISPLTALVKHPFAAAGTLLGIGAACMIAPVLTPILTVGFGLMSLYQLSKSTYNAISNYTKGNYDQAEKDCENVGQGFIGTALTMLGLKQSAKIALEAKTMAKTNGILSQTDKAAIADTIKKGGFLGAIKEHVTLLTTKAGWKGIWGQIGPHGLKQKFAKILEFKKYLKDIEKYRKQDLTFEQRVEKFQKSPEGIRRAGLSEEQITKEINSKFDKVFDEMGISKTDRPKLKIKTEDAKHGGSYSRQSHEIKVNAEAYRKGVFEIDDVIMHEATHCKEAMYRASLPKERVHKIAVDELSKRIVNGESEEIIISSEFFGPQMGKAPKMPNAMQQEFVAFAKKHLYKEDTKLRINLRNHTTSDAGLIQSSGAELSPFLKELESMMKRYPEFVKGYESEVKAMQALEKYALSHKTRYDILTNTQISNYSPRILTAEEMAYAEKSLKECIACTEGNARNQGLNAIFGSKEGFNQYQFSPEEVLAQQKGNQFLINNCKAELESLKKSGTLTPEREAFLCETIKKAEATIAYKTKGQEYYRLYEQHINNPGDVELATRVKTMEKELETMGYAMNGQEAPPIEPLMPGNSWGSPLNGIYGISEIYS